MTNYGFAKCKNCQKNLVTWKNIPKPGFINFLSCNICGSNDLEIHEDEIRVLKLEKHEKT